MVSSSHFTQIVAKNIVMTRMCTFETHQEANGLLLSDVRNAYMPNVGCSSKLFSFCYSNRFLAELVQFIMILILCTRYRAVMPSSVIIRLFERIFGYACSLLKPYQFSISNGFLNIHMWQEICSIWISKKYNFTLFTDNAWDKSQKT